MTWEKEVLEKIINADDLKVSPLREDGVTQGTPTWVWCVAIDGKLYVRAYSGRESRWYKAAMKQKSGKIIAAGCTLEVSFSAVSGDINARIDEAYRIKYHASQYLRPMTSERARAATVQISRRDTVI